MKKRNLFGLAAAILMLTGCAKIEQKPEYDLVPVATSTMEATEPATTVVTHKEVALKIPEITQQEATIVMEAEDAAIPVGCAFSVMPRLGYSGTGYISGLRAENDNHLMLTTEIPATQHYDMTVVLGTSEDTVCQILANGNPVYTLTMESMENFMRVMIPAVFLNEGACSLTIQPLEGSVDIDCITLANNQSLYSTEEKTLEAQPSDEAASDAAGDLLAFLTENYGKKIITGQHVSDSKNKELEQIYQTTGKYPLIRFADLGAYSRNGGDRTEATVIEDSLKWAENGGIVGLSWLWNAPSGEATIYDKDTSFDLSTVVTTQDIAQCSAAELRAMAQDGIISQDCYALVMDIDAVSEQLKVLADADIPVLWRPLPEAGGGWYWWGAHGESNYNWLWNLVHERMTEYHQLHNLLWVWNGQSSKYLVDETTYDIASLDLYVSQDEVYGSRYEQYMALSNMTSGKLQALSECSTVPDMNAMFRDHTVWSYFGLWYDQYLNEYTSEDDLIAIYNSEGALTLGDYQKLST